MTVQDATFNMRGQLYHGHSNAMALSSSPVVIALGSASNDLGSSPDILCWLIENLCRPRKLY